MNGDAIQEVERLTREAAGQTVTIDGREYSTVPLHDPRKKVAEPAPIAVNTLTGFAEYVRDHRVYDVDEDDAVFAHIVSPGLVEMVGSLQGEFNQRFVYARAQLVDRLDGFKFGQFYPAEDFNIALQSRFVQNDDRGYTLKLVGNLTVDGTAKLLDDGASQKVQVRAGISLADDAIVRNPVYLAPFRTFAEVPQPPSPFVLRVRQVAGQGPSAALIEADGGEWKLDAIGGIRAWLTAQTLGVPIIG